MKMEGDISLFLAIEKMMQEKMVLFLGKLVVKDVNIAGVYGVKVNELRTKSERAKKSPSRKTEERNIRSLTKVSGRRITLQHPV